MMDWERKSFEEDRGKLLEFMRKHEIGDNWHEPDNQGIGADIIGAELDNAGCGDELAVQLVAPDGDVLVLNIASLLAMAAMDAQDRVDPKAIGRALSMGLYKFEDRRFDQILIRTCDSAIVWEKAKNIEQMEPQVKTIAEEFGCEYHRLYMEHAEKPWPEFTCVTTRRATDGWLVTIFTTDENQMFLPIFEIKNGDRTGARHTQIALEEWIESRVHK